MSSNPNHLVGQRNPYLLQHIHNPVDWYPWEEEALNKAIKEQKPILLSIGYSTCHWCHVMAHESFENEDIAKIINESFIAIKVDREDRPDLDQIYMAAVTAMTGQGGWPLTVFLTSEGKPFFGGTYFPPFAKWGSPGFMDLLQTISQAWQNQRAEILSSSNQITQALLEQTQRFTQTTQLPQLSLLERAFQSISSQFDRLNGGFGGTPKFPMGHYLSFLLRFYKRSGDKNILSMVESTLRAIASGGIYDHLGGGFHRYSTDAYWHVPHFEKMLYDQALLVKAYLECYQVTGDLQYALIVRETLDYVLREMQHPEGGFYCAQDADSLSLEVGHTIEGAFYVWSKKEITEILGEENASIFCYAFGVEDEGNAKQDPHGEFVGKNILYIAHSFIDVAVHFKKDIDQINQIIKKAKYQLFNVRKSRPSPHLDNKILSDWNGLMLGVFSFAGVVLDEPRYIFEAKRSADFILTHMKLKNRLLHSWCQNQSNILGTLEDYSFFINGLLDLYEASLEDQYLLEAKKFTDDMILLFEDKSQGGFFLTANDVQNLIIRPKDIYDGAIPSGNSVAAHLLIRIYLMSSEQKWFDSLERLFKAFAEIIETSPSAYSFALCALDFYLGPSINVVLEGKKTDPILSQMQKVIYKHFIPNKSLVFRSNQTTSQAYVCKQNVCQKSTQDLAELEKQLHL